MVSGLDTIIIGLGIMVSGVGSYFLGLYFGKRVDVDGMLDLVKSQKEIINDKINHYIEEGRNPSECVGDLEMMDSYVEHCKALVLAWRDVRKELFGGDE